MKILDKIKQRGKNNAMISGALYKALTADYPTSLSPNMLPKSHLLEVNFQDFGGTTTQTDSELISNIDLRNKDINYMRIDYELESTNITIDTYFNVQILLGYDGNDTPDIVLSTITKKYTGGLSTIPITDNFLMDKKLGDYHWFKILPIGVPIVDADIKFRFTDEGISDNN